MKDPHTSTYPHIAMADTSKKGAANKSGAATPKLGSQPIDELDPLLTQMLGAR